MSKTLKREQGEQIQSYIELMRADLAALALRSVRERIVIKKPHQTEIGDQVEIGEGTIIHPFSCLAGKTRIGKNCIIGPYAHIEDSDVGDGARVSHMQLKRSQLADDAKAVHFGYVGDAKVGKGANIAAGVVTCNFDGKKKSRTIIAEKAFIGSGCMLVAPVEIGKGAYTAAGSTITSDVPPGALAIGRGRQENKPDWVEKRKKNT